MKHFFMISNQTKDIGGKVTKEIEAYLQTANAEVETVYTGERAAFDKSKLSDEVDCILVLGGDGTMLQAARDVIDRDVPILGINMGTLGYLAEIDKNAWKDALDQLLADNYEIEERMMVSGQIIRENGEHTDMDYALNDVVVTRCGSLRIINYNVYVNGQFLNSFHADGMIISTPTGSTGYNLSAGGPIVEPKAQLIVITPICPHTLNTRSIILSADDQITLEIGKPAYGEMPNCEADFDGDCGQVMVTGDRIEISRSEKVTQIIKLSKRSFLETLHKKMSE